MSRRIRVAVAVALIFGAVASVVGATPALGQGGRGRLVFTSGNAISEFVIAPGSANRPVLVAVSGVSEFSALETTDIVVGASIMLIGDDGLVQQYAIYSSYWAVGVHCGRIGYYPEMVSAYMRVPGLVVTVDSGSAAGRLTMCVVIAAVEVVRPKASAGA